jgi:hypothetical protein
MAAFENYDTRPKKLSDYAHEFLTCMPDRFTELVITFRDQIKAHKRDQLFALAMTAIACKYILYLDGVKEKGLIVAFKDIEFGYIPLIKFAFYVHDIIVGEFGTEFVENNQELFEQFKILQQKVDEDETARSVKEAFFARKDLFALVEPVFLSQSNKLPRSWLQIDAMKNGETDLDNGDVQPKHQPVMKKKCEKVIKDLEAYIQTIQSEYLLIVSILRNRITLRCNNCDSSQMQYLIEHTPSRESDARFDCYNCCAKHDKQMPISFGFYGYRCFRELERKIDHLRRVVGNYYYFVSALTREDRIYTAKEFKRKNPGPNIDIYQQDQMYFDWFKAQPSENIDHTFF